MNRVVPVWIPALLIVLVATAGLITFRWLTGGSTTAPDRVQNYKIEHRQLPNWDWREPNPATLFVYQQRKSLAMLRGGTTQIRSDTNPTPELDTDGIAEYYLETTRRNQLGWTAERMDDVKTPTERFSVLDRRREGKRIITCFCVKGNTTLVIGMSDYGTAPNLLDDHLRDLRTFLSQIRLVPTVLRYPSDDADLAMNGSSSY